MQWKELLQDMLDMQQKVYTCLQSDACYEVSFYFPSNLQTLFFLLLLRNVNTFQVLLLSCLWTVLWHFQWPQTCCVNSFYQKPL